MVVSLPQRVIPPLVLLGGSCFAVALADAVCGARAHLGDDVVEGELVEGVACPGYVEGGGCCLALPQQRAHAFIGYAIGHDREQVASFEPLLLDAERTLGALTGDACALVAEEVLRPRIAFVRMVAKQALDALAFVEHLFASALCAYCYAEEEAATFVISRQDGPAAMGLARFLVHIQQAQRMVHEVDAAVLADWSPHTSHACIPEYLLATFAGSVVGGFPGYADNDDQLLRQLAVEAIGRLRKWPGERRKSSASFREEATENFDHDFQEVAERLMAAVVGPGGRMLHQVQMLSLVFGGAFRAGTDHPVARMLWGSNSDSGNGRPLATGEGADGGTPRHAPAAVMASALLPRSDDPGAAFGMVVLISNRTAEHVVELLLERIGGPQAMLLEDSCGTALESLGMNCHSGGLKQGTCLTPTHAVRISTSASESVDNSSLAGRRPHVAWRRHAATQTVAHSAGALAASVWGPGATVWLMDLRPEGACPGQLPLGEAVALVPGGRLQLVSDPGGMLGIEGVGEVVSPPQPLAKAPPADVESQTLVDTPLASRLAEYFDFHRRGVASLAADSAAEVPVLVYSCQPYAQCGGHGDRLNGIVTAFLLAVLTRRVFLIDSESPIPLHQLLVPKLIDWRVSGGFRATAGLRHLSYHDKRRQFEADLPMIAEYPDLVLVLTLNYRMLRMLFEAPVFRGQVAALGLPTRAPAFFVAEVFDVLFSPSPLLRDEIAALRVSLGAPQDGRFIAVHLRTGDVAWDPARHGKDELAGFLDCARKVEEELGLPAATPWLLATDSADVAEVAAASAEAASGKLRVPGRNGRIHIDRSDLGEVLRGVVPNFAEWLLFGRAAAVVLSRSYFGETAAEIGRVPFAYFGPGGGCVRTDLTSS